MRRFLTTTAIVLLTAMPVYAQTQSGTDDPSSDSISSAPEAVQISGGNSSAMSPDPSIEAGDMTIHASNLIGHTVHIRAEGATGEIPRALAEAPGDWEPIGEVGDVILSPEGGIDSVALDVGGFLGLGERHVQTTMDKMEFVRISNDESAFFVVYTGDRSALELEPDYDRAALGPGGYSTWTQQRETVRLANEAGTNIDGMAGDSANQNVAGVAADTVLTAEDLQGMPVIDANGDNVGEVSQLVLADSGEIDQVIVDVGGFLGLGEKPVAIDFDDIRIEDHSGVADQIVRIDSTEEELKAMDNWAG